MTIHTYLGKEHVPIRTEEENPITYWFDSWRGKVSSTHARYLNFWGIKMAMEEDFIIDKKLTIYLLILQTMFWDMVDNSFAYQGFPKMGFERNIDQVKGVLNKEGPLNIVVDKAVPNTTQTRRIWIPKIKIVELYKDYTYKGIEGVLIKGKATKGVTSRIPGIPPPGKAE